MNRYPISHMIRIQRVNRIRAPWLQSIGLEVAKLERVAREAKELVDTPVGGICDTGNLEDALKEIEHFQLFQEHEIKRKKHE